METAPTNGEAGGLPPGITEQELRVWRLVCAKDDPTVKQVAEVLGLSPKTVQAHLCKIHEKLDLHSRCALLREGIYRGVIPCPCERRREEGKD